MIIYIIDKDNIIVKVKRVHLTWSRFNGTRLSVHTTLEPLTQPHNTQTTDPVTSGQLRISFPIPCELLYLAMICGCELPNEPRPTSKTAYSGLNQGPTIPVREACQAGSKRDSQHFFCLRNSFVAQTLSTEF